MSPVIDAGIWKLEQEGNEYQLKSLLDAALVIRKFCHSAENWYFKGSLNDDDYKVPEFLLFYLNGVLLVRRLFRTVNDEAMKSTSDQCVYLKF